MLDAEAIKNFSIDKSDWKKVKFGDVVFEPKESVKDPVAEGIEHVVGLEHIDSEDIHLHRSAGIEESTTFTKKFRTGDVLFGRRRAYLKKAAKAEFSGICSGDITVMRAREELLLPDLMPFIINNDKFFDYAIMHSAGGLSPRVKFKDLSTYEFLLPPKSSQNKIIELLNSIVHAHRKRLGLVRKLELFQLSYFENLMQEDTENKGVLGDLLVDIFAGKSPKGSSRPANDDEYGVLKVSAVGDGIYVESENKALVKQDVFNPDYEVKDGYILVTRANASVSGVGRPCIVKNTRKGLMLSDKTLRLIPNNEVVKERFLYQILKTRAYRSYVESVAGGTEAKNISQKLLKEAPAWKPCLKVQHDIVDKLNIIDTAISSAEKSINDIQTVQKSISYKVF